MGRLASAVEFFNGALYTNYQRYPFFKRRAALVAGMVDEESKILIAGCGFGYLVDELVDLGFDAWGVDASTYATVQASGILKLTTRPRILRGDCGVALDMTLVKSRAGLLLDRRFDLCVTEDLLPAAESDNEVQSILTQLRAVSTSLFHIITCTDPKYPNDMDRRAPGLLWKTHPDWKKVVGTEPVMNTESGALL